MKSLPDWIKPILSVFLCWFALNPLTAAAESPAKPNLPVAVEKDPRVQSQGKAWRLDQAKVTDPKRPRVLLIGDSILNGYLNATVRRLNGIAYVDAWVNPYCQGEFMNHLVAEVLKAGPYDVIHFNMGLHGFQRDRTVKGQSEKQPRIPEGQFEPLTRAFVEVIKKENPHAKIIWASTTPISFRDRPMELDPASNAIIIEHNRMATKVMAETQVPINDFYGLLINHPEFKQNEFHWKGPAYNLLAEACATSIIQALKEKAAQP